MNYNQILIKLDNPYREVKVKVTVKKRQVVCNFEVNGKYIGEYISVYDSFVNISKRLTEFLKNIISPADLRSKVDNDSIIPKKLKSGIIKLLKNKSYNHPLIWALILDYNLYLSRIIELFELTSRNLGCSIDDLISKADYYPNDISSDRIQTMFAEMRTINVLFHEKFFGVELIKKSNNRKSTDIIANNSNFKYVIEVARVNSDLNCEKYQEVEQIIECVNLIYERKTPQLKDSKEYYEATREMLSIIIPNNTSISALRNHKEFQMEVINIHKKTKFYFDCDLILFIGNEYGMSTLY